MQIGRFRLGMRTLKSALSVMICILLFHISDRGAPLIAALSAVFALRQDLTTSVSFGRSRIIGNVFGGALAMLYFLIQTHFHSQFLLQLFLLPTFVIVIIVFSDGIGNNAGIISGISTMLLIAMSIPEGESLIFAFNRVLDTFIGILVAVLLNLYVHPKKQEREKQIAEDLAALQEKELRLNQMLQEVQQEIKDKNEQSMDKKD